MPFPVREVVGRSGMLVGNPEPIHMSVLSPYGVREDLNFSPFANI